MLRTGDTDQLFKQFDTEAIQSSRLALYKEKEIVQPCGSLQDQWALKVLVNVKYHFVGAGFDHNYETSLCSTRKAEKALANCPGSLSLCTSFAVCCNVERKLVSLSQKQ